ncbi:MAG: PQQ-dependent sugar dehydrogenase [Lacipirellulaceae bacterium]
MTHRHGRRRTLRVECLERRELFAGDTYLVNFQNDEATTPSRYLRDTGLVFGARGNGFSYGWTSDHTDQSRERSLDADQRFDTLIHIEAGQSWGFDLANGRYEVTVAVGDPANDDGLHTVNVEGVNLFSAVPDLATPQVRTTVVTVSDGRLTLDQGAAGEKATRINFVHIVGASAPGNAAPAAPTINEPPNGQVINPADLHMEAVGYSDPNGDTHKSTDWEVWTTGLSSHLVWQTLGIEGVERLHTHLGDGVFVGDRAGEIDLAPNTAYELRVRFRDSAGSVSAYSTQPFSTASASTTFPLELRDVAPTPAATWVLAASGLGVELPTGTTPGQMRLEGTGGGGNLVSFAGRVTTGNTQVDFPALAQHSSVRVVFQAGSTAISFGPSNLELIGDSQSRTFYLPAVNVAAGQRLDLWVSNQGATFFGNASQTAPDFSLPARSADVTVPFVVNAPGFVIEEVGTGYRLPVNIAFVPNPGPNPSDPLYFVTELYGSIQVVSRDGTKRTFASGLLDYNPSGPISGTGEQGLTGIVVERDAANPEVYQLYVTMLWDNGAPAGSLTHYPKVERLTSVAGGLSLASRSVLLNMQPETQGQSHQISNISIGPDGKLYVHMGDGFSAATALNLDQYRGKILRMNLDGTAPSDNPFYNAANGIGARDYVFAYGVRNPFGGAWRQADGQHYEVENGPSVDRFAKVTRGQNLGWNGSDASMTIGALYNWSPATAPVNLTFIQQSTFAGSQFPASMIDHAFVSESGPTYAAGPQANGKRITEFVLNAAGARVSGPTSLVQYAGTGRSTVVALAAGPDGLYFSEFYKEDGVGGATAVGSRIYRVRYVNPLPGDYDINGVVNQADYAVWAANYGSNLLLAADGNRDGVVNAADYTVWRDNLGATATAASAALSEPLEGSAARIEPDTETSMTGDVASLDAAFALLAPSGRVNGSTASRLSSTTSVGADADDALLLTLLASQSVEDDRTDAAPDSAAGDDAAPTSRGVRPTWRPGVRGLRG